MHADVEWAEASTVGTMHVGMKDWDTTYNTHTHTTIHKRITRRLGRTETQSKETLKPHFA